MSTIFDTIDKAKSDLKHKRPPKYVIYVHADGSTSLMVVMHALCGHLRLSVEQALNAINAAQDTGKGPCGVYTKDLAESLIADVMNCVAVCGTELSFTAEPEE